MRARAIILAAALAGAAVAAEAAPADGYIHGTVSTRDGGSYTGLLRWDGQELFWDDLFDSHKVEAPHAGLRPDEATQELPWGQRLLERLFGGEEEAGRGLAVRFGDLAAVAPSGRREAELTLRSGRKVRVRAGSDDVGATIVVLDPVAGAIEVPWGAVERVTFSPAPEGTAVPARRMAAEVRTRSGSFSGFLQWDSDECTEHDVLDGEANEVTYAVPLGGVARLAPASDESLHITLTDGRRLELSGSNDVNEDLRGALVQDERFGRVRVPWEELVEVRVRVVEESGRAYGDYGPAGPITGTVHRRGAPALRGQLIYDLDETELWETLEGRSADGVGYTIPFAMVASVTPQGDGAEVRLRSGATVRLAARPDVSDENRGVAVVTGRGADPVWIAWGDVERIELDR